VWLGSVTDGQTDSIFAHPVSTWPQSGPVLLACQKHKRRRRCCTCICARGLSRKRARTLLPRAADNEVLKSDDYSASAADWSDKRAIMATVRCCRRAKQIIFQSFGVEWTGVLFVDRKCNWNMADWSALEAWRNALYKCSTYLLTYWNVLSIVG